MSVEPGKNGWNKHMGKMGGTQYKKAAFALAYSVKKSPMARVALTEVATVRWVLKFAIMWLGDQDSNLG